MAVKDPYRFRLLSARSAFLSWCDAYPQRVNRRHLNRCDGYVIIDKKKKLVVDWYNSVEINNKIKELKKMLGVQ